VSKLKLVEVEDLTGHDTVIDRGGAAAGGVNTAGVEGPAASINAYGQGTLGDQVVPL